MIAYVMVIIFVSVPGSSLLEYDFVTDCFPDGSMIITNPDETKFNFFDMTFSTDNNSCHGDFSEDYSHLLLKDCTVGERITIIFLGDKSGIFKKGNYAGPYKIMCEQMPPRVTTIKIHGILLVRVNSSIPTETSNINGSLIITKQRGEPKLAINTAGGDLQWMVDIPEHLLDLLCLRKVNSTTEGTTSDKEGSLPVRSTVGDIGSTTETNVDTEQVRGLTGSNVEQNIASDYDEHFVLSSHTTQKLPVKYTDVEGDEDPPRLPVTLATIPYVDDITAVYAEPSANSVRSTHSILNQPISLYWTVSVLKKILVP